MSDYPSKPFVGGLNANTDDDGLRQHFERFGELIDHVVIKHKVQRRSRCFRFVTYAKPEQADAAMAPCPHTVDGIAVELKRAVAKKESNEPKKIANAMEKKIFVGGLKNDIFEFQLTQYFSQFGQVEKSEIMVDLETRKYRGFGFVHFTDASAADKAALVKFHTVNGHQVEVKKALSKKEIQGDDRTTPRVVEGNQNGLDYPGNNTNGAYGGSHTVDGTMVEVKQAVEKAQCNEPEPPANGMRKKIFVGGLKNDIFEFQLTQYFSQYGQVEKSEIMKDMGTGRNRGFGFVHFTEASAADKAALVKFHTVNGHMVEVKKALTKQKIQGEDGTTPRVVEGNQNGYGGRNYPGNNTNGEYGGSHGAEYSDQGSSCAGYNGYGNCAGYIGNEGYGSSHIVDVNTVEVKRAVEKTQCTKPEPVANAMGKKLFVGGLKNDIFEFNLTQYFSQYGQVEKSEIMKDIVTGRNRGFGFVHFTDPSAADNAALEKFHTVTGHKVEVKKALTKQEIKGEDETTPGVVEGNQNGYGGSHGAEYSYQGSSYSGYYSYENGARFNDNGGYSGTYTCGRCGYENLLGGGNVYNGYGQFYSGYGPNNGHFSGQRTAPYTRGW